MTRTSGLASQVNWLFLKEEDIRKARQVIAAAGPESTVDVLGLGAPVERISDLLFPGTSTLHTQLRYVIFVPAILYAMQELGGVPDPYGFLKKKEAELITSLQKGGLKEGVIGRTRGEALKYWPSMTYWTAVNEYAALGEGSYDRAQVLEQLALTEFVAIVSDDGDSTEQREPAFTRDARFRAVALDLFADAKKARWREKLTFDLPAAEARLLIDQIHKLHPQSLYVEMLGLSPTRIRNIPSLFDVKPKRAELAALLQEAELYSLFSMGATLVYRWALCGHLAQVRKSADNRREWAAFEKKNKDLFAGWLKEASRLRGWRIASLSKAIVEAFPAAARVGDPFDAKLAEFCDELNEALQETGPLDAKLAAAGRLVRKREEQLKGNRSRFRDETIAIPGNVRPAPDQELQSHLYSYRWEWGKDNALSMLRGLGR